MKCKIERGKIMLLPESLGEARELENIWSDNDIILHKSLSYLYGGDLWDDKITKKQIIKMEFSINIQNSYG